MTGPGGPIQYTCATNSHIVS